MLGIGSTLGVNLLSSCSSLGRLSKGIVDGEIYDDQLLVPLSAFLDKSKPREYIIVHNEKLQFPICVYRFSDKEFSALWMECTHQGAELQVFGDKLECPAHGSEFDASGIVENGPADKNLRTFPTELTNKYLKIKLT